MGSLLDSRGCPFPLLYCLALPTAFSHFRQIVFCSQLTPFCVCDAGKKECGKGGAWQGAGGRQAEIGPLAPYSALVHQGLNLAAGCLHPEQYAASPCPPSKEQSVSGYRTPSNSDRVLFLRQRVGRTLCLT